MAFRCSNPLLVMGVEMTASAKSDTPSFPTSQGEWEAHWAFYQLAIKERDFERIKCDRIERELTAARTEIAHLEKRANAYAAASEMWQDKEKAARAEAEANSEAIEKIRQWCKAYPVDVFTEPDWRVVKEKLGDILLTQVSASNMRHVVTGIQKIIDAAKAKPLTDDAKGGK